jgi:uncharacterized protein YndB with AHSA1/START domain
VGDADVEMVAEQPFRVGRPGADGDDRGASRGRIFERTPAGQEHDWGEVLVWEPPHRLAYLWHLRQDRADATHVEISFRPEGDGTRVSIVHSGWERLGDRADPLRDRNRRGWAGLVPHFARAAEDGG